MSKLIIALDFDNQRDALTLLDQLDPALCAVKVGSEMYTLFGAPFVRALISKRFNVFLDLKFHDIPSTVARACSASAELGVWMLNVHASGGLLMMQAAKSALDVYGHSRPLLIAVTVLTSMSQTQLSSIGVSNQLQVHVGRLARLALDAGLDGVVSSALEVPFIKSICGASFITVTPGIRMPGDQQDDQTRIITPALASKAGSDYLVIGRSITRAINPAAVIQDILHDLAR